MRNEPLRPVPKPGTDKQRQGKTNKRHGSEAERAVAKRLGGRRVWASGSTPLEKGDVKQDDLNLFVEVKFISGSGIGLRREWFEKTILDAQGAGLTGNTMLPVVAVRFPGGGGYYATTAEVFEALVAQVRSLKAQLAEIEEVKDESAVLGHGSEQSTVTEARL